MTLVVAEDAGIDKSHGASSDDPAHPTPKLVPAEPPFAWVAWVRVTMMVLLVGLFVASAVVAVLYGLMAFEDRSGTVLPEHLERVSDVIELVAALEVQIALGAAAMATLWMIGAAVNAHRATQKMRLPWMMLSAIAVPVAVVGAWLIGSELLVDNVDWPRAISILVLQAIMVAIPLLVLERIIEVSDSRYRPTRVLYLVTVAILAQRQFLAAVPDELVTEPTEWVRTGANHVIATLLMLLALLAANEGTRAIEEGTRHRYELRRRFGEHLSGQVRGF